MVCGEKGVGVNREPTSRDYIAGMLDGDVIFVSICFMIIYIMLIDMLFSYEGHIMLLVFLLFFCIKTPFVKTPQENTIVDFLESDEE